MVPFGQGRSGINHLYFPPARLPKINKVRQKRPLVRKFLADQLLAQIPELLSGNRIPRMGSRPGVEHGGND